MSNAAYVRVSTEEQNETRQKEAASTSGLRTRQAAKTPTAPRSSR